MKLRRLQKALCRKYVPVPRLLPGGLYDNAQLYSQPSEAEKHHHTYPQLCPVHGILSPEGSSAATSLHIPYKTKVLSGLQICPLQDRAVDQKQN